MSPKPLWRWWLFCAAFWLAHRTRWRWPIELMAWCVTPQWLGHDGAPAADESEVQW